MTRRDKARKAITFFNLANELGFHSLGGVPTELSEFMDALHDERKFNKYLVFVDRMEGEFNVRDLQKQISESLQRVSEYLDEEA